MSDTNDRDAASATVTKIIGAPGSGKTYRLLRYVERERTEHGVDLRDLMFCTFSRAARRDAKDRIARLYDTDTYDLDKRVKTVHAAALAACRHAGLINLTGEHGDEIISMSANPDVFAEFFMRHHPAVDYDTDAHDPLKLLEQRGSVSDMAAGNAIITAYNYVKSKAWELDDYHHAPVDVPLARHRVLDIMADWEQFKQRRGLFQHHDYVALASDHECVPPTDVLLIDEFQDLDPMQYRLYKRWRDSGAIARIYIAGDPHQAIHGFRGADPQYFVGTPTYAENRQEVSRRCPQRVIEAAKAIAAPVAEHDVASVTAARSGGRVEHVSIAPGQLGDLVAQCLNEYEAVDLLARTNRQTWKLAQGLQDAGIPYSDLKPDGGLDQWCDSVTPVLDALRGFETRRPVTVHAARTLLENVTAAPPRREAIAAAQEDRLRSELPFRTGVIASDRVRSWFPEADTARDIIPLLTFEDRRRQLLGKAIRSGVTNDPEAVRVGTIHAAKGLEAPCVLVFPTYTSRLVERYHQDHAFEAEERRLYYVALTRAEQAVFVVHEYLPGDEFPPLSNAASTTTR